MLPPDLRARLDDLIASEPGHEPWAILCKALDALSGDALTAALAHVEAPLERWSIHVRRAPDPWIRRLLDGQREPRLRAARSANLTGFRTLKEAQVEAFSQAPEVESLRYISFALCNIDPKGAKHLAASPHLAPLEAVSFSLCRLGDTGLSHLSKSPHLTHLKRIELNSNGLKERAGKIFATTRAFAALEQLVLGGNRLGLEGARWLSQADLPALRRLELGGNEITSQGFALLAASRKLASLSQLDAGYCRLDPGAVESLAASPLLERLEDLGLSSNGLGEPGARALARLEGARLRALNLSSNQLGDAGAAALAAAACLSGLERLELSLNQIDGDGARALAASPALSALRELSLSANPIGPHGLTALARSPLFDGLTRLDLSQCALGDDGAAALADCPGLTALQELRLDTDDLGDRAAQALAASPHLGRLTYLSLHGNRFGKAGKEALLGAKSIPRKAIHGLDS